MRSRDDLKNILRFAVDPDAQTTGGRITLTLLDVEQIMGEGRLDSSGRASENARRIKRPARRAAEEDLGWWDLAQGSYWVAYNERVDVPDGHLLLIQPHVSLMKNGLWHPTVAVEDWDSQMEGMLLLVSSRGVMVSENAPLSVATLVRLG
ncbi:MAG: hypothetical protein JSV26_03200 [bacterium]|nr:MAG: hypothetical protein JSV26_03200 [bacterium]